jgi:hypothetical protein
MRSRKVFRIYKALSIDERAAFGLYLASPYFGLGQRLVDFRKLLEEALVLQPEQQLTVAEVWQLLPDVTTAYRANGFDKLCAELLSALNDFLAMQEFRAQPTTVAALMMEGYVARHLDEWVPSVAEGLIDKLGKDLERDAEGLHAHLKMTELYAEYIFRQPRTPQEEALLAIDQKLTAYYASKKLELASLIDVYNRSFNSALVLPDLDFVHALIQTKADQFPMLIRLRAAAWLLTSTREDRYYWKLKALFLSSFDQISRDQTRPISFLALNHLYFKMNLGDSEWEAEADAWQMFMLEAGLFEEDDRIAASVMKNIVQVRLLLGNVQWVADFLTRYKDKYPKYSEDCSLLYNESVLAFHQGRYIESYRGMETVIRDWKEDFFYGTDARIYQLMCLYERWDQEDTADELDARLNAFRVFLLREKRVGQLRKERYLNLVKQFRRLISLYAEPEHTQKEKAKKFLKSLDNFNPVSNRRWFQHKVQRYLS